MSQTKKGIGMIPVLPINDSIRLIKGEDSLYIDRKNLYKVQTPQCFMGADIKNAYNQNFSQAFTDDASVLQNNEGKIVSVLGEIKNLKITTIEDLKIAEVLYNNLDFF